MTVQEPPEDEDAALARAIADGGVAAREAELSLYRRFAPRIALYGRRHLRDEQAATDLVQEVMLRTLEALRAGRVDDPTRLGSFILGTCRYAVWDLRRGVRRARDAAAELRDDEVVVPREEGPDRRQLEACLQRLAPREVTVVLMTFHEDRSAEEIAQALSLEPGNVRVIRHRALARLSACMDAQGRAA